MDGEIIIEVGIALLSLVLILLLVKILSLNIAIADDPMGDQTTRRKMIASRISNSILITTTLIYVYLIYSYFTASNTGDFWGVLFLLIAFSPLLVCSGILLLVTTISFIRKSIRINSEISKS